MPDAGASGLGSGDYGGGWATGVGAGTDSYGGGYSGGYGMDAGSGVYGDQGATEGGWGLFETNMSNLYNSFKSSLASWGRDVALGTIATGNPFAGFAVGTGKQAIRGIVGLLSSAMDNGTLGPHRANSIMNGDEVALEGAIAKTTGIDGNTIRAALAGDEGAIGILSEATASYSGAGDSLIAQVTGSSTATGTTGTTGTTGGTTVNPANSIAGATSANYSIDPETGRITFGSYWDALNYSMGTDAQRSNELWDVYRESVLPYEQAYYAAALEQIEPSNTLTVNYLQSQNRLLSGREGVTSMGLRAMASDITGDQTVLSATRDATLSDLERNTTLNNAIARVRLADLEADSEVKDAIRLSTMADLERSNLINDSRVAQELQEVAMTLPVKSAYYEQALKGVSPTEMAQKRGTLMADTEQAYNKSAAQLKSEAASMGLDPNDARYTSMTRQLMSDKTKAQVGGLNQLERWKTEQNQAMLKDAVATAGTGQKVSGEIPQLAGLGTTGAITTSQQGTTSTPGLTTTSSGAYGLLPVSTGTETVPSVTNIGGTSSGYNTAAQNASTSGMSAQQGYANIEISRDSGGSSGFMDYLGYGFGLAMPSAMASLTSSWLPKSGG